MPKPNPHRENINRNEFRNVSSEKVVHETKPNFWLYSDNFILKIVVLFLLVLFFAPIMTLVYSVHSQLVRNFHIAIDNVMFYSEIILLLLIVVVIIKLILDVLDWNYTNYLFTDSRIIIERGFIHKEKIIISYNKIQDIEIRQSLLERIVSVGDIIIYGANEMSETILDDIPSPKKVEDIIITNVNKNPYSNMGYYPNQPNYNNPYPNQQGNYNPYPNQQGSYNPYPNQQGSYNPYPNQVNYEQNPNQGNYNPNVQENYQYIQPEDNNSYNDDDVIIPDRQYDEVYENRQSNSNAKLNKEEIFRKHDEMFKRHKK